MTLFHLLALINNFEGIQSPRVVSLLTNLERMEKILEMEKRDEYSHVKNLLFEDGTSVKNFLYHWFHLAEYYCYARKELSKEQIEVLHTLALKEDIRLSRKK